jgi:ABC-type transport system involved in multi-copper enzyme maturation permease subunit
MISKELREAWWKVLIGMLTPLVTAASLGLTAREVDPTYVAHRLSVYAAAAASRPVSVYDSWVWIQAFTLSTGATVLFLVVAALLGSSLVVGEVTRGTISFLLTRSQSRDRILLTKYGVGAALLLAMAALIGLDTLVIPAALGNPQHPVGVAISVVLLWLEALFVLGLALVFSITLRGTLQALVAALLTIFVVTNIPAIVASVLDQLFAPDTVPHSAVQAWSLGTYWLNLDAFAGNSFPWLSLLVSTVVAAIPLVISLQLFRRRAY